MHQEIIKDLISSKGKQLAPLIDEFTQNARWAGYFVTNPNDITSIEQTTTHDKLPKTGFHITTWHMNHTNGKISPEAFLQLMTATSVNVAVIGYADDGLNQALQVTKPEGFLSPATPHITVSWRKPSDPAMSGYLNFQPTIPEQYPQHLVGLEPRIYDRQTQLMDISNIRQKIGELCNERMDELANLSDLASSNLLSNETADYIAKLYALYQDEITALIPEEYNTPISGDLTDFDNR